MKAAHDVVITNSKVNEASDLIYTAFAQALGPLSTSVEDTNKAEWTK